MFFLHWLRFSIERAAAAAAAAAALAEANLQCMIFARIVECSFLLVVLVHIEKSASNASPIETFSSILLSLAQKYDNRRNLVVASWLGPRQAYPKKKLSLAPMQKIFRHTSMKEQRHNYKFTAV